VPTFTDHTASLDGVAFSHRSCGQGRPIILVHGIGPGTTAEANFSPLLEPLSRHRELHLIDLIGFGRSARKANPPFFDVELWVRQIEAVVARFGGVPIDMIGNSVGGALALKTALRSSGVERVIAIGAPGERYPIPKALSRFWAAPESPEQLAAAMKPMTAKQLLPDPQLVETRFRAFRDPAHREYFAAMTRGGQTQLDAAALTDGEAAGVRASVTLIHGRLDRACPPSQTVWPLSRRLPSANVFLLAECGHNVIWEQTKTVFALIDLAIGLS
jgi:pimeloyl-ACP methyl ester carboxylesterase